MADCLDETTVVSFLEGGLTPDARATVEEHIGACSACAELVTWVAADQGSNTMRLPGHEGRPFVGQLHPGSRVGRYQILGGVGRGGMGEVYAAYHPDLDRRVALKVVQGSGGGSGERRVRLLREARAIARLSHPNVVTVHDAGTFGDRVFIVMELIDGQTIDQWLRAEPRTWQQVLDVFIGAGRGLAAAHAAGVIHRDFKPQNVMIGNNGVVRVMDFGLARLAQEEAGETRTVGDEESTVDLGPVTKTGAFIGTPAYMSPEQFRRETSDARSDQFSFCVALHEALFGTRPTTATADGRNPSETAPDPARNGGAPGWLRTIIRRGASVDRERRYPSMDALLAALERGRRRTQRRLSALAAALVVLLLVAGAWRVARGNRFVCATPNDRIGAVWSTDAADPQRQAIHRAFATSGRATAETSWKRVSTVLDDYMRAWSAMYVQTCEATHVRGEQSAEILDLRMSCLNDNLEQVRALTNTLESATGVVVSRAVAAAVDLTPINRCADVMLLKSALPLPKDERTLREVQRLRRSIAEMQTRLDLGDFAGVQKRAAALRSEVIATGYKPLLSELSILYATAESTLDDDPSKGEAAMRNAVLAAEAAGDGVGAAKAAAGLAFVTGYRLGRLDEATFWAGVGHAILDRIGGDQRRVRAWLAGNLAAAMIRAGDFAEARALSEKAISLKEESLGNEHPDVAISLAALAYALVRDGRPAEGLAAADRAIAIVNRYGDPESFTLGYATSNRAEALTALARYSEAEKEFKDSLRILSTNVGAMHSETAFALQGLGETSLARNAPRSAVPLFEQALRIRQQPYTDPVLLADSQFGLARALRESGVDSTRGRDLARAALAIYKGRGRAERTHAVAVWLAASSKRR